MYLDNERFPQETLDFSVDKSEMLSRMAYTFFRKSGGVNRKFSRRNFWQSKFSAFGIFGIRDFWHSGFLAFGIFGIRDFWHSGFLHSGFLHSGFLRSGFLRSGFLIRDFYLPPINLL